MRQGENSRPDGSGWPIEALTFDVTDTLMHAPEAPEIYCRVLRRHGLQVRAEALRQEMAWVWKEFSCSTDPRCDRFAQHPKGAKGWWQDYLARVCQRLGTAPPSPFAGAELFDRFAHAESWQVYDDVLPTLRSLQRQGIRLAVISNWDHRLPELLDRLGLLEHFEVVVYSADTGVEKPHARMFQRCLEELGVEPDRAMHLGDQALEDIEGALAVGMRALRVDRQAVGISLPELIRPMLRRRPPRQVGWAARRDLNAGRHVRP